MKKEMPMPPGVAAGEKAQEILRTWIVGENHEMQVSVDVAAFKDSRTWGVALADLARHIANSYEAMAVAPADKVLKSISDQFNQEVANPTSAITSRPTRPV